jgi:hypothetical protein
MRSALLASSCFILALLAGCAAQPAVQTANGENLTTIANAYLQATEKQGKPPASMDELKAFLPAGANLDELARSPNDGQPFVILWGVDPRALRGDLKPGVLGYEQKGTNGSRFVFTAMGVMSMTDADFAQANFPAGHAPP